MVGLEMQSRCVTSVLNRGRRNFPKEGAYAKLFRIWKDYGIKI